jgi:hypothetical protein
MDEHKTLPASSSLKPPRRPGGVNKLRQEPFIYVDRYRSFAEALRNIATWFGVMVLIAIFCWLTVQDAKAADLEWFVQYQHTSDILRGCPWHCETTEPTQEFASGGLTITAGTRFRWELDIAHGYKAIDCSPRRCAWEPGTQLSARFYPLRNRGTSR